MKNLIFCTVIFCANFLMAQNNLSVELSYDKSGNLTERKIVAFSIGRFEKPELNKDSTNKPILFKISPNPTSTYLNLEREDKIDLITGNIDLINLTGQIIKTIPYYGENLKSIDVSNLKSGLYFLIINFSKTEREIHKIIIND